MIPTKKNQPQPQTDGDQVAESKDMDSIRAAMMRMAEEIEKLKELVKLHNHTGEDGTGVLRNTLNLAPSEIIQMGNMRFEEVSNVGSKNVDQQDLQKGFIVVGKDKDDTVASNNMQLVFENQGYTDRSTNQSFVYGQRYPLFTGVKSSVSSGGSVMTVEDYSFKGGELIGAQAISFDVDGANPISRYITGNTNNIITVQGTWGSTRSDTTWMIFMPVYLGAAQWPWRQVYAGGESVANSGNQRRAIRLGHGATVSCQAIYFGSGSPESVVTAVIGSMYLRSDGSTSTTLYIKTSGTGNTGWTAK